MNIKRKFLLGVWNIGIINTNIKQVFNNPKDIEIRWMKHKYKDRFFADPFLEGQDVNNYYLLAEEFVFYEGKGKIVRLTVDKKTMKLLEKEIILNEKFHLSYPFLIGDYIIPEAYRSGALFKYKISNDNKSYNREKLIDQGIIDPTFLEYANKSWVFATSIKNSNEEAKSHLSIFFQNSEGDFIPHKKNPIKVDIRTSRPGGRFFTFNGEIYRPVQDSKERYGHFIRLMKIEKLTDEEYTEREVLKVTSENNPPFDMGLHTFNVYSDFIVVDGYKEYSKFILKPIMKIFGKFLLKVNYKMLNQGREIVRD